MTMLTEVFVPGKSLTKGSWTFVTKRYAKAAEGRKEWERQIAQAVSAERHTRLGTEGARPFAGAVHVELTFFLPLSLRGANSYSPVGHHVGDIDKLARLVLDALKTGGVYTDDSVVVALDVVKCWASDDIPQGALITAWPATPDGIDLARRRRNARTVLATQGMDEETGF